MNKNKTAIALILMFAMAFSLVALPNANAQPVTEFTTFIYVYPQAYTGVGQQMFIVYAVDYMPPDIGEQSGLVSSPSGRAGWYDITLEITDPDGELEIVEMPYSDPVGGGYLQYTPAKTGTYSVVACFPGAWKNHTLGTWSRWYKPSESAPANFTVQAEPIESGWPEVPLPDDCWMRPISGPAHSWSAVAGNWLGGAANVWPHGGSGGTVNNYGYGSAPESAHILWTRQFADTGAIMDERFGAEVYTLNHYQGVGYSSVIVDGKIHCQPIYNAHISYQPWTGNLGWMTLDLYTGEQLFLDYEAKCPQVGQIYLYESPNQHGGFAYLWRTSGVTLPELVYLGRDRTPTNITETPITTGTLWEMLDGLTGKPVCYVANVSVPSAVAFGPPSGGMQVYGKDGSILYYDGLNLGNTSHPNYYLQVWNMSAIQSMLVGDSGTNAWMWRPSGGDFFRAPQQNHLHDGSTGFSLNVSMPSLLGPRNAILNQTATVRAVREGEYVIFGTTGQNDERGTVPAWFMGVSLEEGKEGTKLWESTIAAIPKDGSDWYGPVRFSGVVPEADVAYYNSPNLLKYWFYDLKTAELLWEGDIPEQFAYYGLQDQVYLGAAMGLGEHNMIIIGGSFTGVNRAYDIRTGELLWTTEGPVEGTDSPYGRSLLTGFAVADGKLYTGVWEHSASSPLWRGRNLNCFDVETGERIWDILFWGERGVMRIADGILTSWNMYDGQIYAFGRGPSATTVTATPAVSVHGSSVLVKGTVSDQTATGRRNVNNDWQFSLKGTPAISDEDMTAWMEYKFMGQAKPADAKGVEVILSVLDPNDNVYEIGRTTSDIEGNFGLAFEPLVPGDYQLIAAFEGSASYYPSSATTYITVDEAPAATPPPTPPPASVADIYFVPAIAGIIVAIIVVGLLLFLLLRKR